MRKVINRRGEKIDLNIEKIREKLVRACESLDVSMVELESHIDSIYVDGTTTKRIQESLINLAASMTSIENCDWSIVAGRLLMMEVEREIYHNRGFSYGNFTKTINSFVEQGIYDERLKSYNDSDLKELCEYIDYDRDMEFDYAGANMFTNRYLLKYEGKLWELPQEVFMTISMLLAINESDKVSKAKTFYDALSLRKISLATPILANLRIPKGNLSSCFISAVDDNIESIFYNIDSVAKISKNGGGVGINLSRLRSKGSHVNGYPNASGGVVPWIRIFNDTAVAVNQQGRRAGAVTMAIDIWHLDIDHFLELQTENGDQRGKAYDIYPQVVISDLFMERVKANKHWTLFDPYEIRVKYDLELCELFGEEFEKTYKLLEADTSLKLRKTISAKELLKDIMKVQIETGMPYIFFKDTANRLNHNKHKGMIGNGNLCMESFSNFSPTKNFENKQDGNKGTQECDLGEVHTCNLVSLNLSELTIEELETNTIIAARMLDNTIDLTSSPIRESGIHNDNYRTIGIGAMGLADYLAKNYLAYEEAEAEIDKLFEQIAIYSLKGSALLAKERGKYKYFDGSDWSKGIFFGKSKADYQMESTFADKWSEVYKLVEEYGLRNAELTAVAPNTSSSLIMGATASVNPTFSRFFIEKNQKGAVPRVVKYIKEYSWFYTEFRNIDPRVYVTIMSRIGKWVSQGVSMELIFDLNKSLKAKDIFETIFTAWEEGCKSIYYIRTIQKNSNIAREKEECESCSG